MSKNSFSEKIKLIRFLYCVAEIDELTIKIKKLNNKDIKIKQQKPYLILSVNKSIKEKDLNNILLDYLRDILKENDISPDSLNDKQLLSIYDITTNGRNYMIDIKEL